MVTKRKIPIDMSIPITYDYEGLKRLGVQEHRPTGTLIALAVDNDPFSINPRRQAEAKWFAALWHRFFGDATGIHLRRMHYKLMSQRNKVPMSDGTPYVNSEYCWKTLYEASKDARYLRLVSMGAFIDRRNPEAIINTRITGTPELNVESGDLTMPERMPEPPKLILDVFEATQRYQVEIWVEKSTINDILKPLGERYGIHIVTGLGELSITACDLFVKRANEDGRPVRILYVSDFDPGGQSMPVAVARKIEFMLYDAGLDLDVQVRPVVLTKEQCEEYGLPRTPIKDEKRGGKFEEKHGEGATELDALEALHPGVLAEILEREIARYWDDDLETTTEEAADPVRDELEQVNAKVHKRFAKQIAGLRKEYAAVVAAHAAWAKRARNTWRAMEEGLHAEAPDMADVEWPEPKEGDDDFDPLFDSTRDYIEQIDRYKEFQGKPTSRVPKGVYQNTASTASEALCAEVRKLHKAGRSLRNIARDTNLSQRAVYTILHR